ACQALNVAIQNTEKIVATQYRYPVGLPYGNAKGESLAQPNLRLIHYFSLDTPLLTVNLE
ncbi:hypothetical protein, partial [Nostoc sp. PCC 7120 = FACHB-418]|uniref:hypothetical protein n=1 Tax=Nostoc sp. (strain PCC 7120 / SAG 25.82 / UTEX 2576) TaxID=103690 RepID=UPI001F261306